METEAIIIMDGTPPVLSCQSEITQIAILANHPFSNQEIQAVFQTVADHQIALQRINLQKNQIVFSIPSAMTGAILSLLPKLEYHITTISRCATINISGGQVDDVPKITANILKMLHSMSIPLLQLNTSQTFISILIEQCHLTKAKGAIEAHCTFSEDHG
ncbi:ACT domain-containing protein [Acetonema longum]|uniref:Aspartate kinase I n=1 Tax=Acetonema longum DSM 6540 TaxID=1009370 RepID=F7NJB3_9FIRM|nr:ACT domain-containing protein [Acetonema longum]EGO63861.1 aspartate kinase I [Acetonema longum DSM 6540]